MPVFPQYNALFIHIPRTSGTSIERTLGLVCRWPELDTDRLFGWYNSDGKAFALQHLTCTEILAHGFLQEEGLAELFTFTMVRNPYDRCVSLFRYWGGEAKWGSFEAFVRHLQNLNIDDHDHSSGHETRIHHLLPQYRYVFNDSLDLMVDCVCRFEHRQRDLRKVFSQIGFDQESCRPRSSTSYAGRRHLWLYHRCREVIPRLQFFGDFAWRVRQKKKRQRYQQLYDEATRQRVREIYAKDFELFNYA